MVDTTCVIHVKHSAKRGIKRMRLNKPHYRMCPTTRDSIINKEIYYNSLS